MNHEYNVSLLKELIQCPSKAYFALQFPPDTITETEMYLNAMNWSIRQIIQTKNVKATDIKEFWKKAIVDSKLYSLAHPSSRYELVNKGLSILFKFNNDVLNQEVKLVTKPIKFDCLYTTIILPDMIFMEADGTPDTALVLTTDPVVDSRQPIMCDPVKIILALRRIPYVALSLHTGIISKSSLDEFKESYFHLITSLVEGINSVHAGHHYPRYTVNCRICAWNTRCKNTY